MTKSPKKSKGLLCPVCAVPTWVTHTRPQANGTTVRWRVCKTCGHKQKTYERPATS